MGRKQTMQLNLDMPEYPPEEPPEERPPAPAAPARRPRAKPEARPWRRRMRFWLGAAGLVLAAIAGGVLFYQFDQFLASSPLFALAGNPEQADRSNLRIEGTVFASPARIARAFASDFGRSVYLLPLAERRRSLLAIDWVRNASVSREWPNRLVVRILERVPVAFAALPAAGQGSFETAVIDAQGVILDPPSQARFTLPVLFGISRDQPQPVRRERVGLMLELIQELDAFSGQISEVDVGDPENLKITQTIGGRAVRLLLGNQRFLPRLRNFLNHYPEIRRRLPKAAAFDLRLDDRITALEGSQHGQ